MSSSVPPLSTTYDGDITGSIVIDATAVNTSRVGSYTVTYNVTDATATPPVQVTRTVDVVDTTVPVITLVGADPQTIEVGSPYVELGATALDNYDGDITGSIVIDATAVNTAVVGCYLVTYNVTDANGNPATQVTRTVDVVDTTIPVITLVGADPQDHRSRLPLRRTRSHRSRQLRRRHHRLDRHRRHRRQHRSSVLRRDL